ncbi:unnamed protein product [Vitrella brassicaformis CCMP3155]|uniref:Uncharacterized protein n=1 Tax=Vitrella brassicaformis (strain CCMP3155) TaxID=1169540 RepID=A0A0G4EJW2_VITBC|nr:unnamed protein product [Vitrella brassicaformis CCMP3155]|eukprot:CEL96683.1 unnamed protein product [Vitrella brassicaformis CCMP3155]
MDSSHDVPAPSRGGRGDLSDDSLRDVIDQIQSIACQMATPARRARELIQRSQHDTHVCASAAGRRLLGLLTNLTDAHSALSNELTQTPTNHNKCVPADDAGAKKRRRVDISHTAGGGGGGGGHSEGGSVGAGGAAAESQQQHEGGGSSRSADLQPHQQPNQQQQHHIEYIFVGRRTFYLLSLNDILRLRKTCKWARGLFGAPQLRQRLSHSLSTQAGLRRTANGQQLLTFDDQQMGEGGLLAALCVTEAGGWSEMSEVIELAGQCGSCQLPVRLTTADLHRYPNKTAYLAAPRVLAQLKVVGPHIHLGDGVTFALFQHGTTLRAIQDQDGFEIDSIPPLPPGHLYQQHRQQHDPPTIVIGHFNRTHQNPRTTRAINRHAGNIRLLNLLTLVCGGMHHHHIIPLRYRPHFSSSHPDQQQPHVRRMDCHLGGPQHRVCAHHYDRAGCGWCLQGPLPGDHSASACGAGAHHLSQDLRPIDS